MHRNPDLGGRSVRTRLILSAICLIAFISVSETSAFAQGYSIGDSRSYRRANDYFASYQIEVDTINPARTDYYNRLAAGGTVNNQFGVIFELLRRYRQLSPDYTPYRADPTYGTRPKPVEIVYPTPPPEGEMMNTSRTYLLQDKRDYDTVIEERRKILDTISKINRQIGGTVNGVFIAGQPAWAYDVILTLSNRQNHLNRVLDDAVATPALVTLLQSRQTNVFERSAIELEIRRIADTFNALISGIPADIN